MSGCGVVAITVLLLASIYAAPTPTPRTINSIVSGDTTGLEIPRDLIAGTGTGMGAMQLVINVHTDSLGNIEVYTN